MIKKLLAFFIILLTSCILTFGIHLLALHFFQKPLFDHLIVKAYSFNFLFALLIYAFILLLSKTKAHTTGFVFMASSLIKFAAFFLIFYPIYSLDDEISRQEFLTFFIPYAVCLTLETAFLIKHLNSSK